MSSTKHKRVTVKHQNPNPLFEKWLTEWRDKAQEKESKMQYIFNIALKSLKKYPLPLETGKDCKILHGFGVKLCTMLDDKLVQYKAENGDINIQQPIINIPDDNPPVTKSKKPRKRKISSPERSTMSDSDTNHTPGREYIPKQGSGAFAILLALYEHSLESNTTSSMRKAEVIAKGQNFTDTSFTNPGPDNRYTAWSSMKTLLDKKLVHKQGNPPKFSLTEEGVALSDKLYIQHKIEEFQKQEIENEPQASCSQYNNEYYSNQAIMNVEEIVDIAKAPTFPRSATISTSSQGTLSTHESVKASIFPRSATSTSSQSTSSTHESVKAPIFSRSATSTSSQSTSSTHESVILAPNSFQILLFVDNQELNGSNNNRETDPLILELKKLNVIYEIRDLKVGDYVWVCRDSSNSIELVLPYIIERKRMDDLGHSIKDSRFNEQKFRLKQCGLENLIYLVESYGKNEHVGLPITSLMQAAINTLIQDGFTVKFTENLKGTCAYLACMSTLLTNLFKGKTLVSCPKENLQNVQLDDDLVSLMHFKEFNKSSIKARRFKVWEMFIKHLLQIKGMSLDKALAIVDKYPTPKDLKQAYNEKSQSEGEKLLSQLQFGNLRKNLGPCLSKIVYQVYCNNSY